MTDGTNAHGKKKANKANTLAAKANSWKQVFAESIGGRPINEVTEDDLIDLIEGVRDDGHNAKADAATRHIKAFFQWAKLSKRKTGLTVNPAEDLRIGETTKRIRFLTKDEVRWFAAAVAQEPALWRDAYMLALLTGLRRGEALHLERIEVNIEDRSLDIPAARMKPGVDHRFPVGPAAWAIVQRRAAASDSRYIFPALGTEEDNHVTGYSSIQDRVAKRMVKIAAKEGAVVERWTFHDLRRTLSTHVNGLKDKNENRLVAKDHVERCLSHVIGGVEGIYDRQDYYAEKRRAFTLWETEVRKIIGPKLFGNIEKPTAVSPE